MYICEVIPLKTSKKIEFLTYYTPTIVNPGDLVLINMHGQKLRAVVFTSTLLRESKIDIKSKTFKIKKIDSILQENYISSELLPALYNISTNIGTSINNILSTLTTIEGLSEIKFNKRKFSKTKIDFICNQDFHIKNLKENEFILAPTKIQANNYNKDYNKINGQKKLVCSTPCFDFLSEEKITHIYILNECSNYYYRIWKGLDTKLALTHICNMLHIDITYVDNYPSLSTYSKMNELKIRERFTKKVNIIKMNEEINKSNNPYIHQDLKDKLLMAVNEKKKVIIYNLKKGYANYSICADCNNYVSCESCNNPYKLTERSMDEVMVRYHECSKCNIKVELIQILLCDKCNSYNINTLGIGTESVQDYMSSKLSIKANIIDSEHNHKKSEINKIINNWSINGGVIIGTDLLLNNMVDSRADLIIITSLDALYYIKNYMIDELLFYKFNNIKSLICDEGEIYLETRREINELMKLSPKIFYKEELSLRDKNNLPPYYKIITFTSKEENINAPFLDKYKNIIYRLNNKYKYIYFIDIDVWVTNHELRSIVYESLKNLNLEVDPIKIID